MAARRILHRQAKLALLALAMLLLALYSCSSANHREREGEGADYFLTEHLAKIINEAGKLTTVPAYGRLAALIALEARKLLYEAGHGARVDAGRVASLERRLSEIKAALSGAARAVLAEANKTLALYSSTETPEVVRVTVQDQLRILRWKAEIVAEELRRNLLGNAYLDSLQLVELIRRLREAYPVYLEATRIASEAKALQVASTNPRGASLAAAAAELASKVLSSYPPPKDVLIRAYKLLAEAKKALKAVSSNTDPLQLSIASARAAVARVQDSGVHMYLSERLKAITAAASYAVAHEDIGPYIAETIILDSKTTAILARLWRLYLITTPRAWTSNGTFYVRVPSTVDLLAFYSKKYTEPQLLVYTIPVNQSRSLVSACCVEATPFTTTVGVRVEDITSRLAPGVYNVVLYASSPGKGLAPSYTLTVRIEGGELHVEGFTRLEPRVSPCTSVDAYRAAILCGFTPSSLALLKAMVLGLKDRTLLDALWSVYEWASKHLAYSPGAALGTVMKPLDTLKVGGGVCRDFSVFTAAALLAAGFKRAYIIISFDAHHAFAAVDYNNTMLAVDYGVPPSELGDYVEYVLARRQLIASILYIVEMKEGMPVVREYFNIPLKTPDTYPQDVMPPSIALKAVVEAVNSLGAVVDPTLAPAIAYNITGKTLDIEVRVGENRIAVWRLYTPLLKEQWKRFIVEKACHLLRSIGVSEGWRAWVTISFKANSLVLAGYGAPAYTPSVRASIDNNRVTIYLQRSYPPIDPQKLTIVVYSVEGLNARPCAVIAAPLTVHLTLHPVIYADYFACSTPYCVLSVNLERLESFCPTSLLLVVVYDDYVVASFLL